MARRSSSHSGQSSQWKSPKPVLLVQTNTPTVASPNRKLMTSEVPRKTRFTPACRHLWYSCSISGMTASMIHDSVSTRNTQPSF